jgi:glycosyltransferase involved in cell wall biosynthesis
MKIAVYTIALNEEQFVQKWYDSAKDADYLLIADTGSTDATVELAKSLGINVVNISIKPWRFDDARNAALAMLPSDINMCISLDMDEVLTEGWREALEKTTGNRIQYKYVWSWKDAEEKHPHITHTNDKIHSRYGFRWKNLVHETVVKDSRTTIVEEFCEELEIHHHPNYEKSRNSYADLNKANLNEDPTNPRYIMYHANDLKLSGNKKEAAVYFKKFLKYSNDLEERSVVYRKLSECVPNKELFYLLKSYEENPNVREPLVMLSIYYFKNKNWEKCYEYANKAVAITKKKVSHISEEFAWGWLPYNLEKLGEHNMNLDKSSPTYKKDLWTMNMYSSIPLKFNLFNSTNNEESTMV